MKIASSAPSAADQADNSKNQCEIYFLLTLLCCFELKRQRGNLMMHQLSNVCPSARLGSVLRRLLLGSLNESST
jgi:hypothetical protein